MVGRIDVPGIVGVLFEKVKGGPVHMGAVWIIQMVLPF